MIDVSLGYYLDYLDSFRRIGGFIMFLPERSGTKASYFESPLNVIRLSNSNCLPVKPLL